MGASSLRPELLLAAILSSTEEALLSFALDGIINAWSRGAERLYGYSENEITGQPLKRLLPLHEIRGHEELLAAAREGKGAPDGLCDRLHKSGCTLRLGLTRTAVRGTNGDAVAIVERGRTVKWNNSVNDAPLRWLLQQMPGILWTTDRNLRITSHWGVGLQLEKLQPAELVGRSIYDVLKCQDAHTAAIAQHAVALGGTSSRFEYNQHNRDFEIHLEPLRDSAGSIIGCIGAGIDVTERKRGEEQARYEAKHDALTGLANYREFVETLERELRRAERTNHSFALLLLDLDDLKHINDRWGHLTGNRALRRLAAALREQCRATDLAARYGGDEFGVLLIDADPVMAQQVAERVESALEKDREHPPVRVSIGVSVYPDDGRTASELFEEADQNLYRHKRTARRQLVSAQQKT